MTQGRYRSLDDPETLRFFVRNLREGVYITNDAGRILDANPACLEILGFASIEELRTHRLYEEFVAMEQEHVNLLDIEMSVERTSAEANLVPLKPNSYHE